MPEQPTIVLTGASAGIGFAILEALVEQAFVVAISRSRPALKHPRCHWLYGDLRTPEATASSILQSLRQMTDKLDGLVHCAATYGSDRRHPFLETRDDEWADVMQVNVHSQFVLTTRLLPLLLRSQNAFIVALSSDVATNPAPGRIAYGCSKAASHALFSGLAAELSGSTVSVIQLVPARQVVTRGMRQRRPQNFDFAGYSQPDIFREPIRRILEGRGAGLNGACFTIQ